MPAPEARAARRGGRRTPGHGSDPGRSTVRPPPLRGVDFRGGLAGSEAAGAEGARGRGGDGGEGAGGRGSRRHGGAGAALGARGRGARGGARQAGAQSSGRGAQGRGCSDLALRSAVRVGVEGVASPWIRRSEDKYTRRSSHLSTNRSSKQGRTKTNAFVSNQVVALMSSGPHPLLHLAITWAIFRHTDVRPPPPEVLMSLVWGDAGTRPNWLLPAPQDFNDAEVHVGLRSPGLGLLRGRPQAPPATAQADNCCPGVSFQSAARSGRPWPQELFMSLSLLCELAAYSHST